MTRISRVRHRSAWTDASRRPHRLVPALGIAIVIASAAGTPWVRAQAACTHSIAGHAQDADGTPIAAGPLAVGIGGLVRYSGDETRADGSYRIDGLCDGAYEVFLWRNARQTVGERIAWDPDRDGLADAVVLSSAQPAARGIDFVVGGPAGPSPDLPPAIDGRGPGEEGR